MNTYDVEADDLTEEGVAFFLQTALQISECKLDDWMFFGPLLEQYQAEISYYAIDTSFESKDARHILSSAFGREVEPWQVTISREGQDFDATGRSIIVAFAKSLIMLTMRDQPLVVPEAKIQALVRRPDWFTAG